MSIVKRKKKIQIPPKALSEVLNDGNEVELLKSEVETAISQQKELTDTQERFASFDLSEPPTADHNHELDVSNIKYACLDMSDNYFSKSEEKNQAKLLELKNKVVDELVNEGYVTQFSFEQHELIWALNTISSPELITAQTIIQLINGHREWLAKRQSYSDSVKSQLT